MLKQMFHSTFIMEESNSPKVKESHFGSPSYLVNQELQSYFYGLSLSLLTRIPDLKRSINAHG